MAIRGFLTFVADGEEKTTYNHSHSQPYLLGAKVLRWLRCAAQDVNALRASVTALRVVDETTEPSAEDIERLREFADTRVSGEALDDWYILLRDTQGDPAAIFRAGVIEDNSEFPQDSLSAEWGYVVDTDTQVFEVYQGFCTSPHDRGRFADRPGLRHGYYPVALVYSWPLAALPTQEEFEDVFASGVR